jgi:hypothetical protein
MTKRHNKLINVVRKETEKLISGDLRSEIQENEGIDEENLPDELQRLRPDMMFERRKVLIPGEVRVYRAGHKEELRNEEKVIEIIEFSCP